MNVLSGLYACARCVGAPLLAASTLLPSAALLHADGCCVDHDRVAIDETAPHVRTTDTRLRHIVEHGAAVSPTLRALIERLEHSDIVAYLVPDVGLQARSRGRLSFVATAGGVRYVRIELAHVGSVNHQTAFVGHELRHAVEVADTPAIVDTASFDRAYARIGFLNAFVSEGDVRSYETRDAIDAGSQILKELLRRTE
jgi:hypothetical protein